VGIFEVEGVHQRIDARAVLLCQCQKFVGDQYVLNRVVVLTCPSVWV
jgi:hypothetical protein